MKCTNTTDNLILISNTFFRRKTWSEKLGRQFNALTFCTTCQQQSIETVGKQAHKSVLSDLQNSFRRPLCIVQEENHPSIHKHRTKIGNIYLKHITYPKVFFEENCVRHVLSALSLQAIASFLEENEGTTCSMLEHICTTVQLALLCVFLERELLDNKPSK